MSELLPCAQPAKERRTSLKDIKRAFPKGSAPPTGYVDWHNWAEAQDAFGLKQAQCHRCKLWIFPQERPNHMTCEVQS
jgi:hypothetical protein